MSSSPTPHRSSPQFKNAPGFRATGKGYFNRLPDFPATIHNANGLFINRALPETDRNYKLPVFIHALETGWQVAGTYGQAANGRTWYPHNLSQDALVLSGICANQYEYDRLAEFIRQHQVSALAGWVSDPSSGQGAGTRAVEFTIKPYLVDTGRKDRKGAVINRVIYGGLPGLGKIGSGNGARVQGYIEEIEAGHERFKNVVPYEISLRVSYDFLDGLPSLPAEIDRQLEKNYMKTFNQLFGRDKNGNLLPPTSPLQGDGSSNLPATSSTDFWQAHGLPQP